jgi:hypothetical protein
VRAPPPPASPAARFRTEIEKAAAEGVARDEMTLHLTYSDVTRLKRDAQVPLPDITFADGVMRFLGVRVEQGGVAASALERP